MATKRFVLVPASVLVALPLMVSCNTRYHLAGKGSGGGAAGSGGATGSGGGAGASDGGMSDASIAGPVPFRISPRDALTRVARVLWETVPDQALVAIADSGTLVTDEDVRRVALTMLSDPRARVGVSHFYRWWLDLDAVINTTRKDPALFPEYTSALAAAMAAETEAFAMDVTFDGDGKFPTLMRGSYSFVNESLAKLYGVPGVTGADLRKVDLDPTQRAGILTQPSFLTQTSSSTSWTSPTRRGYFVADKILCRRPPPPPPEGETEISVDPPVPQTNRQRLMRAVSNPECAGCHALMDPLGFAFESFDSIGRVRVADNGLVIDASGTFQIDSGEATWKNVVELAQILAKSRQAEECLGMKWLTYVLGRDLTDADTTSVTAIGDLFVSGGLDLRTAIAATVSSASFLDPTTGGPPCVGGLSQNCNDDVRVSSLHGMCTPAGKCVCNDTSTLNPATGRCR